MLSVIIPYRSRREHKEVLVPALYHYLTAAGLEFEIIIVEQFDNGFFNRGKLLNIGFLHRSPECQWVALHDVDHVPVEVDYSFAVTPTQLVKSEVQMIDYLGGVTLFNVQDFLLCDGFSNEFWDWGGEDNELFFRMQAVGLTLTNRFGKFDLLPHTKHGYYSPKKMAQAREPRRKNDGLSKCDYNISRVVREPLFRLRHLDALI